MRILALAALAILSMGNETALAAIVPVAQLRQVAAGGTITTLDENVTGYDSKVAEDFGVFDESTGLALRTVSGTATVDGFTKQVSGISSKEISVFGSADSFVYAPNLDDTAYAATGSQFSLRFSITDGASYRLIASGFAANAATSTLLLKDANDGELVAYDAANQPSLDLILELPVGEYSITATADSSGYFEFGGGQPDGRSEINLRFTQVPEPSSGVLAALGALGLALRLFAYSMRCRT